MRTPHQAKQLREAAARRNIVAGTKGLTERHKSQVLNRMLILADPWQRVLRDTFARCAIIVEKGDRKAVDATFAWDFLAGQ